MVTFDYSQKTVLVTGGSSGIGLATARRYHDAGAKVIILSRNPNRVKPFFGNSDRVTFLSVELSNVADIQEAFRQITTQYDTIDIAINNAAAETGIGKPIHQFSEAEFDYTMGVNLKGLWLCMKHEIEIMLNNSSSRCSIINISSINGLGGVEHGALYAASKAGILGLTKSAALELATSHISVNAIVPGPFDTPLLQMAMLQQVGGDEVKLAEMRQRYEQFIPQKRIGNPKEVASLILWLTSDEATYLVGQSIIIDGGMTSRYR